jgi:hypothetical protein
MLDLGDLFDFTKLLQGSSREKAPRPFQELVNKTGLSSRGTDAVLDFERTWAHFVDDLLPVAGKGAMAIVSGDWSGLSKENLTDVLGVWKVWTRYRDDLEVAAKKINPFAKGGRGVDPRVSQAAQEQLKGFNAFRQAVAPTEAREKKGMFARFKDWFSDKTTDLKKMVQDFDLDEWSETGLGQVATGTAAAGMVAAMSYRGDVEGYRDERELPERERFGRWAEIEARYPEVTRIERPKEKSVTKLGYGTVIGNVPDGRVVLQTAVSLWVVDPSDL